LRSSDQLSSKAFHWYRKKMKLKVKGNRTERPIWQESCTEQEELTGDGVLAVLKNSGNGSPPLPPAILPALPGAVLSLVAC
jgi:hypothetical protein